VRDGGIIPLLADDRRQTPRGDEQVDLEVRHYGHADGRFELYDDDGTTFAYERGSLSWTPMTVRRDGAGVLRGEVAVPPVGKPFGYRDVRWRMMTTQ
jgi:alpha-glucosidase (family GH31 glycosyl hydrolase)